MLREEIEYMTHNYRGLAAARDECFRDGKDDIGTWWGSKATIYRDIMRDLGYTWRHNEFIKTETLKRDFKPAKDFDLIQSEVLKNGDLIIKVLMKEAPQIEAEELVVAVFSQT